MFNWRSSHKNQTVEVTVSTRTIIRALLLVLLWFVALAALRKATHALLLLFTAFFLALALNSPVHWLSVRLPGKRRGSRPLATTISFLVVLTILLGFIASIAPPLIRQTNSFIKAAPHLVSDVRSDNTTLGRFVREHHLQDQATKLSNQLSERLKHLSGTAVSTFTKITSSIFATLTILVLTFMMLIEGPRWLNFIQRLIPDDREPHINQLGRDMYQVVKGYVNGQVFLAALAAAIITPMLFILGVSYPAALIVIIFICGLIPLVGHTIGALIVSTVALFHSVPSAIIMLSYYILYQQIENYVVQPRIQANSTNLSPLLVLSSVIIGVSFGGLFGGLVAIPVTGCIKILVLDYLETQKMLDPVKAEKS